MAFLAACGGGGTNFDDPVKDENYSSGDVDLSRYVALGDSLTAGFKDGTLYLDGQLDSFPNILSQLFAEAGGGAFVQPLVGDNLGGLLAGGVDIASPNEQLPRLVLANISGSLTPIRQSGTRTMDLALSPLTGGPYNNMGVPGAKSFHITANGYGNFSNLPNANPWAIYLNIADGTNNILGESLSLAPTFFTLWIGNNDVLGYATGGGVGNDSSTTTAYGLTSADITDPVNVFTPTYNAIVTNLTSGGAKGILVNIPSIVDIPFFTTVPFNSIPLDATQAAGLNAFYAAYNAEIAEAVADGAITSIEGDQRTISFTAGQNAMVMIDKDLSDLPAINAIYVDAPLKLRQTTEADYMLLPLASIIGEARVDNPACTGEVLIGQTVGTIAPLIDCEVLSANEADEVEMARSAYNTTIETLAASSSDLALYDAAADLADLNDGDGISFGTGTVNSTFATGGAFSLDGVHPTAKGYAIIANGIIDTMNASFSGTDLPRTDPGTYTEVFFEFPAGFDFSP